MALEGQEPIAPAAEVVVDQPVVQKPADVSGTQPDKSGDYEKRITGITADLVKERKARQQYESDLKAAKAEIEAGQKRVRALAGVETPSAQQVEDDAIKQRLEALGYPTLSKEDLEAIREMRQTQSQMQQTSERMWEHRNQVVKENLREGMEKELGGKLTERQMTRVVAEYVREAENNPDFYERHERGDKTLVAEFVKQLSEDLFEPARRKVTQQESQRFRPVPSGKDRGIVTHGEKKIDVNDSKAVEDFLVKGFRERNGEFTGRR